MMRIDQRIGKQFRTRKQLDGFPDFLAQSIANLGGLQVVRIRLDGVDLGERLGRGVMLGSMRELAPSPVKYNVSKLYNKALLRRA
jgi:hypothetical protein